MCLLTATEASWEPWRLLKNQDPPVRAVKTFAYKISTSLRRQTTYARQRYRQKFRQLEAKFLNSSQGEAGLIYAVPDIPANVTPAELAAAFDNTLTRLCTESREIQPSSIPLSSDSPRSKDLLDLELENHPATPDCPQTTSSPGPLVPELSDSSTAVDCHCASQASIDDLLFSFGTDELQPPIVPTPRQYPTVEISTESLTTEECHLNSLEFLRSLSFDGSSPYPLMTKAESAVKRPILRTRAGILDTGNRKALLRRRASGNLRQASTRTLAKQSRLTQSSATPTEPNAGAKRQLPPQCLRPGPFYLQRPVLPRPITRPLPVKIYTPSKVAASMYVAYQPSQAPLLPVPPPISNTIMEDITNELDKVLAAFDTPTEGKDILECSTSKADGLDPLLATLLPIVPLRIPSRAARNSSETIPGNSLSFRDRLRQASRSAILAAADEAGTLEQICCQI